MKKILGKVIIAFLVLLVIIMIGIGIYFSPQSPAIKVTSINTSPINTSTSPYSFTDVPYRIVTASSLNVRACPSTSCEKVGILVLNDKVMVMDEQNGWCKIEYNNKDAYVSCSYLSK